MQPDMLSRIQIPPNIRFQVTEASVIYDINLGQDYFVILNISPERVILVFVLAGTGYRFQDSSSCPCERLQPAHTCMLM